MYSRYPTLSQIWMKNNFGKEVFIFSPKLKRGETKIVYFATILKRYKYFIFYNLLFIYIFDFDFSLEYGCT